MVSYAGTALDRQRRQIKTDIPNFLGNAIELNESPSFGKMSISIGSGKKRGRPRKKFQDEINTENIEVSSHDETLTVDAGATIDSHDTSPRARVSGMKSPPSKRKPTPQINETSPFLGSKLGAFNPTFASSPIVTVSKSANWSHVSQGAAMPQISPATPGSVKRKRGRPKKSSQHQTTSGSEVSDGDQISGQMLSETQQNDESGLTLFVSPQDLVSSSVVAGLTSADMSQNKPQIAETRADSANQGAGMPQISPATPGSVKRKRGRPKKSSQHLTTSGSEVSDGEHISGQSGLTLFVAPQEFVSSSVVTGLTSADRSRTKPQIAETTTDSARKRGRLKKLVSGKVTSGSELSEGEMMCNNSGAISSVRSSIQDQTESKPIELETVKRKRGCPRKYAQYETTSGSEYSEGELKTPFSKTSSQDTDVNNRPLKATEDIDCKTGIATLSGTGSSDDLVGSDQVLSKRDFLATLDIISSDEKEAVSLRRTSSTELKGTFMRSPFYSSAESEEANSSKFKQKRTNKSVNTSLSNVQECLDASLKQTNVVRKRGRPRKSPWEHISPPSKILKPNFPGENLAEVVNVAIENTTSESSLNTSAFHVESGETSSQGKVADESNQLNASQVNETLNSTVETDRSLLVPVATGDRVKIIKKMGRPKKVSNLNATDFSESMLDKYLSLTTNKKRGRPKKVSNLNSTDFSESMLDKYLSLTTKTAKTPASRKKLNKEKLKTADDEFLCTDPLDQSLGETGGAEMSMESVNNKTNTAFARKRGRPRKRDPQVVDMNPSSADSADDSLLDGRCSSANDNSGLLSPNSRRPGSRQRKLPLKLREMQDLSTVTASDKSVRNSPKSLEISETEMPDNETPCQPKQRGRPPKKRLQRADHAANKKLSSPRRNEKSVNGPDNKVLSPPQWKRARKPVLSDGIKFPTQCKRCGESCNTRKDIVGHMMKAHQALWKPDCEEGSTERRDLIQVLKVLKKLKCEKCGNSQRFIHAYMDHIKWCGREDETYTCDLCGHAGLMLKWKKIHLAFHDNKDRDAEVSKLKLGAVGDKEKQQRSAAKKAIEHIKEVTDDSKHRETKTSEASDEEAVVTDESSSDENYETDTETPLQNQKGEQTEPGEKSTRILGKMDTFQETWNRHTTSWDKSLFPDLYPRWKDWSNRLTGKARSHYLPQSNTSLNIRHSNLGSKTSEGNSKPSKLKLFESSQNMFFAGGPVWATSWCPVPPDDHHRQYAAVSCHMTMEEEHCPSEEYIGQGLVQLWDCGLLNVDSKTAEPVLALGIAHDFGCVYEMVWCPAGCFGEPEKSTDNQGEAVLPRLGLLAMACSDGTVRVFSVPDPTKLTGKYEKTDDHLIIKASPCFSLTYKYHDKIASRGCCTCLDWDSLDNCRRLIAGYGRGHVCLFDLTSQSPLLSVTNRSTGLSELFPFHSFLPHQLKVTSCKWSLQNSGVFVTGSSDRQFCVWNQEATDHPVARDNSEPVTSLGWVATWNVPLAANALCSAVSASRAAILNPNDKTGKEKQKLIAYPPWNIWDIDVSQWLHSLFSVNDLGIALGQKFEIAMHTAFKAKRERHRRNLFILYEMTPEFESEGSEENDLNKTEDTVSMDSEAEAVSPGEKRHETSLVDTDEKEEKANGFKTRFFDFKDCCLHFKENPTLQSSGNLSSDERLVYASKERLLPKEDYRNFPMASLYSVSCNPNAGASTWLLTGGQAGIVRLNNVCGLLTPLARSILQTANLVSS